MKSVVCNVFGMAAAVACLALLLNRPAGAEDQEKDQEKREVTTTTVVQGEPADTDVAEALQKALQDKMEGLPQNIQEKIKEKLRAIKGVQRLKVEAHPHHIVASAKQLEQSPSEEVKTIVVTVGDDGTQHVQEVSGNVETKAYVVKADGGAGALEVMASDDEAGEKKTQAIHIVAETMAAATDATTEDAATKDKVDQVRKKIAKAKQLVEAKLKQAAKAGKQGDGEREITITTQAGPEHAEKEKKTDAEKTICIAIAVDGDEISAKEMAKTVTVTLEDGKLVVNGKPIELPLLNKPGEREIKVEVTKKDGEDTKRAIRRKMIFMGEDGKSQEFSFDADVNAGQIVVGQPHSEKTATATAHAVVVAKVAEENGPAGKKPRAQSWTIRLDPKIATGPHDVLMFGHAAGHSPLPHAIHFDPAQTDKTHAEFTKRLKGIESELKKIHKLLEQMQKDNRHEDDDDDDDD